MPKAVRYINYINKFLDIPHWKKKLSHFWPKKLSQWQNILLDQNDSIFSFSTGVNRRCINTTKNITYFLDSLVQFQKTNVYINNILLVSNKTPYLY